MRVINMFAGPGAGKSTTAFELAALCKRGGIPCELVTEYAKDMVYEDRDNILADQLYILAKQTRRVSRLRDKGVDLVITDSPLLLTCIYNRQSPTISHLAVEMFMQFDNVNFFIDRVKPYQTYGRKQTSDEAEAIDKEVRELLRSYHFPFTTVAGDEKAAGKIVRMLGL